MYNVTCAWDVVMMSLPIGLPKMSNTNIEYR